MRHTSIDIDLSQVHPHSHEVHAQSQPGSSGYNESSSSKQASHGNGTGTLAAVPSRPEYCTAVPVPAYPHGRRPLPIPPCRRLPPIGGEQQETRTQSISVGSFECDDVEDKEALAVKLGLDLVSALDAPTPEQELPGYVDRDVDEREGLTKDAQDSGPVTHQVAVSRNPFPNAQHEKTRPASHQEFSEEKLDQRTPPEHFAEEQLRPALSPMIYSPRSLGQADFSEDEIEALSLLDTISLSFPSEMAHGARYDVYTQDLCTTLENGARDIISKHTRAMANEAEPSSGSRIRNASFRPVGPFFCGPYGAAYSNRSKGYEDLARAPGLHRKPSIYASTYATPQFTSSLERTDSCRSDRSFYASGIDLVLSQPSDLAPPASPRDPDMPATYPRDELDYRQSMPPLRHPSPRRTLTSSFQSAWAPTPHESISIQNRTSISESCPAVYCSQIPAGGRLASSICSHSHSSDTVEHLPPAPLSTHTRLLSGVAASPQAAPPTDPGERLSLGLPFIDDGPLISPMMKSTSSTLPVPSFVPEQRPRPPLESATRCPASSASSRFSSLRSTAGSVRALLGRRRRSASITNAQR